MADSPSSVAFQRWVIVLIAASTLGCGDDASNNAVGDTVSDDASDTVTASDTGTAVADTDSDGDSAQPPEDSDGDSAQPSDTEDVVTDIVGRPPAAGDRAQKLATCSVPSPDCTGTASECAQLVQVPSNNPDGAGFDADLGYVDYPGCGETWADQDASYMRRDVLAIFAYAAAATACLAEDWSFGNGGPLGINLASESDGGTPALPNGNLCAPTGTYAQGLSYGSAYFQTGTADNAPREVCDHQDGETDAFHCVAEPDRLDPWRTALFLGLLYEASPNLRVTSVDGRIGPILDETMRVLCSDGWLAPAACTALPNRLRYETAGSGSGNHLFYHHHIYLSYIAP